MTWASLTQAPGERKEWLRRSAHKGQNASGEEIKNLILDMLRVLSLCDSQVSIRVVDTILQLTNGVDTILQLTNGDTDVCRRPNVWNNGSGKDYLGTGNLHIFSQYWRACSFWQLQPQRTSSSFRFTVLYYKDTVCKIFFLSHSSTLFKNRTKQRSVKSLLTLFLTIFFLFLFFFPIRFYHFNFESVDAYTSLLHSASICFTHCECEHRHIDVI